MIFTETLFDIFADNTFKDGWQLMEEAYPKQQHGCRPAKEYVYSNSGTAPMTQGTANILRCVVMRKLNN